MANNGQANGRYDERTALVVVDVQHDFAHPEGSLFVTGGDEVVPFVNAEIAAARAAGATIVFTQDWHPETTPHFEKDGGVWPVHCVQETWGAELHRDLDTAGPVIRKGVAGEDGYSGFMVRDPETGEEGPTELDGLLREAGVQRVVIVGLATDVCVKATALHALERGYEVEILADGTRAVNLNPGDGFRAIAELVAAGAKVS
jgi:nicotinamidase/pyrazinamidase